MKSHHKRKRGSSTLDMNKATAGDMVIGSGGNNNQKKKKKRPSEEELHNEEAERKYSKLVHVSAKTIRKEAKMCKAFECQKIVRKIKALKSSSVDSGGTDSGKGVFDSKNTEAEIASKNAEIKHGNCTNANSKIERKIKNLEEKLRLTRAFELDELVDTCLTRLGLDYTKASHKGGASGGSKKRKNNDDEVNEKGESNNVFAEEEEKKSRNDTNQQFDNSLIESMLQHKKMLAVIESVNESISEYNRWSAKREEWLYRSSSKDKNTKKSKDRTDLKGTSALNGDSGLFIDSLAGEEIHLDDEDYDSDNNQEYDEFVDGAVIKKNRMGQRARRARAMALESKKVGKSYDLSTKNWWEMKPKNQKKEKKTIRELASGLDASKQVAVAEVAEMGSNWKEEGKAHPSWAARQVQKEKSGSGIGNIEFKGKKITFD